MSLPVSVLIMNGLGRVEFAVDRAQASGCHDIVVVDVFEQPLPPGTLARLRKRLVTVLEVPATESFACRFNAGVRASTTPWIGLLNPNELPDINYLHVAAALGEATASAFVGSWNAHTARAEGRPQGAAPDLAALLSNVDLIHPSTIFRRAVWDQVEGLDDTLADDALYDFWLRILERGNHGAFTDQAFFSDHQSFDLIQSSGFGGRPGAVGPTAVFAKHRDLFVTNLPSSLCERDRRIERLRGTGDGLRRQCADREKALSAARNEVSLLTNSLRAIGRDRIEWGDFARLTPISPVWGADRGRCIDRYYIESFVEAHSEDIRGHVLEMHDSDYTRLYGGPRVEHSDVLDIDPTNPRTTIVADLRDARAIPSDTYDCFIMTQTLHFIYEIDAVLRECVRILKPGGILLATLPFASRIAPEQGLDRDFWRFTPAAARRLFEQFFRPEVVEVRSYGNVLVNIAYLYGLACHELTLEEFETHDPYFPVIISVRAQK